MKAFLHKHMDDVLVVSGATLIVVATAVLSFVAALYVAGACMVVFGVLIGMGQGKESR
jgi:uncharacterized membrane protein